MFIKDSGKPTKSKKIIYLLASVVLGLLLSVIVRSLIEMNYLFWSLKQGVEVTFYGDCALPPWLQTIIWLGGGVGGFWLGNFWWRKLYVEKVWAKRRLKFRR